MVEIEQDAFVGGGGAAVGMSATFDGDGDFVGDGDADDVLDLFCVPGLHYAVLQHKQRVSIFGLIRLPLLARGFGPCPARKLA